MKCSSALSRHAALSSSSLFFFSANTKAQVSGSSGFTRTIYIALPPVAANLPFTGVDTSLLTPTEDLPTPPVSDDEEADGDDDATGEEVRDEPSQRLATLTVPPPQRLLSRRSPPPALCHIVALPRRSPPLSTYPSLGLGGD